MIVPPPRWAALLCVIQRRHSRPTSESFGRTPPPPGQNAEAGRHTPEAFLVMTRSDPLRSLRRSARREARMRLRLKPWPLPPRDDCSAASLGGAALRHPAPAQQANERASRAYSCSSWPERGDGSPYSGDVPGDDEDASPAQLAAQCPARSGNMAQAEAFALPTRG